MVYKYNLWFIFIKGLFFGSKVLFNSFFIVYKMNLYMLIRFVRIEGKVWIYYVL